MSNFNDTLEDVNLGIVDLDDDDEIDVEEDDLDVDDIDDEDDADDLGLDLALDDE